jgi:hypothetical protein
VEYYRTEAGRLKKRIQNGKRNKARPTPERDKRPEEEEKPTEKEMLRGTQDGSGFDAGMVSYLRMVTSLIEGRRVSRDEIEKMLTRVMRQHSMACRRRVDYLVWFMNKNPP